MAESCNAHMSNECVLHAQRLKMLNKGLGFQFSCSSNFVAYLYLQVTKIKVFCSYWKMSDYDESDFDLFLTLDSQPKRKRERPKNAPLPQNLQVQQQQQPSQPLKRGRGRTRKIIA